MANKTDLQTILARHIGRHEGITAEVLARDLCVEPRHVHSLVLESKLRHVPLPELLGQLRLKT